MHEPFPPQEPARHEKPFSPPKPALSPELPAAEFIDVGGHTAFVMLPGAARATGRSPVRSHAGSDAHSSAPVRWVWYAPTLFPHLPDAHMAWIFESFLSRDIAVAGIDAGESYGSPQGTAVYSALYERLTKERGFSARPALLPRSRGGLMLYNWASRNADSVSCIAGIYPVCDLASYPGLAKACGAYGMSEEALAGSLHEHNPVDRTAPLAAARVPIWHIHGDQDRLVPLGPNSAELIRRYRALGGPGELRVAAGQGHNLWSGFFRSQELVDFVLAHIE